MSIQPEDFLSQSPSAFLEQPGFLERGQLEPPKPKVEQDHNFLKVAIGIAAAVVMLRVLMKSAMAAENPKTAEEVSKAASRVYKRIFPVWMQAAVPAVTQAYLMGITTYKLGATEAVSYGELEAMASSYAAELGNYVNESSILALTEGFSAQVNAGWSERLAWTRASEAYGLDSNQMRSYVKGLMSQDPKGYLTEPIPAASRAAVDRAFMIRADRLGQNEAFKASQIGRNVVWLSLQASGQLPDGTMKRWVTADDERVCVVCGPLHMVEIPLHRRFESNGQHFYAPGVHPNCRCEIELVYPELGMDVVKNMPGDPWNRNENGEWAAVESRKAKKADLSALSRKADLSALSRKADLSALSATKTADLNALSTKAADLSALAVEQVTATESADLSSLAALLSASQSATETKVKTKEKSKVKTKALKPSDPQVWDTTAWIPGELLLRSRAIPAKQAMTQGTVIDISKAPDSDAVWAVRAYEDRNGVGMGMGTGFDDAFEAYMEQEGKSLITANEYAAAEAEKKSGTVSDPKILLEGLSQDDPEYGWAEALSSRDKRQLVGIWRSLSAEPGGYVYLGDPPDPEDVTATEMAQEILYAAKTEAQDNFKGGNERVIGMYLDDRAADLAHERRTDPVDLIHDRHQMLADDSTAIQRVEPVFFRAKGWYGTKSSNVDGTVRDAFMSGQYKVTGMYRKPVPEPVREHYGEDEIASTIKNIVIVDIELDEG